MSQAVAGGPQVGGLDGLRSGSGTTPGRLRLLVVLTVLGCGLLWLLGAAALIGSRDLADSIGGRVVPAAVDAQELHESLADADRSAANAFLAGAVVDSAGSRQYDRDIATVTGQLERAAELNGPDGPDTHRLRSIGTLLSQYITLVETARVNARQGFPVAVAYLRSASNLMHRPRDGILAQVDGLGAVPPGGAGDAQRSLVAAGLAAFSVLLVALLAVLVHAQLFYRHRFRRRRSPPLLAATGLLLLLGGSMGAQAFVTQQGLAVAQGDAIPRLHALWQIRALADDANGYESLSLISHGGGLAYDEMFHVATVRLVDRTLTDELVGAAGRGDVRFGGLVADELRLATTPDEVAATLTVLRRYRQFISVDAQARASAAAGDYQGAAALVLGTGRGQMGSAFAALQDALGRRIAIEQSRLDSALADSRPGIALDLGIPTATIAIAVLVYWALRPRLAEYTM